MHHLTLQTPDIEMTKKYLEDHEIPYFRYRNYGDVWKELFIHPKHAFGILLQIAEFRADDWIDSSWKMPEGKKWAIQKDNKEFNLTLAHPGGGKVEIKLRKEEIEAFINDLKKFTKNE